jgi:phenylalanyl-tRNA synthetase alpha chain
LVVVVQYSRTVRAHRVYFVVYVQTQIIEDDLKEILTGLARHLFGDVQMRWNEDYFPFTTPSFELEVFFNGNWLEVLGCGVIHPDVLQNAQQIQKTQHPQSPLSPDAVGWAFGLGLERLAMVLFGIPDIRLFWSADERFLSQFHESRASVTFVPYSKFPMCYKDVSFWLPVVGEGQRELHVNDVYEVSSLCSHFHIASHHTTS